MSRTFFVHGNTPEIEKCAPDLWGVSGGRYHDRAMSLPDTIFIFGLALVIFGPKKLPEIGRQLGKLVLEFRRASNEFKMQIEEELRAAEIADKQKALATPVSTPAESSSELTVRPPSSGETVSTESPAARVVPVHEEVSELEAVAGHHPELPPNGLNHLSERQPEQAPTNHD
jgi:TatA/E family protein of Tat protein translocase